MASEPHEWPQGYGYQQPQQPVIQQQPGKSKQPHSFSRKWCTFKRSMK